MLHPEMFFMTLLMIAVWGGIVYAVVFLLKRLYEISKSLKNIETMLQNHIAPSGGKQDE